jgi:5-methylthioadenosine/S-adenosylhomocysteine deaminase
MPLVPADLRIDVRWLVPMTARDAVLEQHSLLVRDGRILEVIPTLLAAGKYAAGVILQRDSHVLIPGLVNSNARGPQGAQRSVLPAIAHMLKSGITSFADRYASPLAAAQAAQAQGIRVRVGMPVAEFATPWADGAAAYFSRALALRDEYRNHPLVSTVFAPLAANHLKDATFSKLATLADELDAGIALEVNSCASEVRECETLHGVRPLERLSNLGLLTPALNAVHMAVAGAGDIDLAGRTGMSITLCPQMDLFSGSGLPPAAAFVAAGIRLGVGSANSGRLCYDIWGDMKLLALIMHSADLAGAAWSAWDALAAATCGGAAILGLDAEVGTLEAGKWADLCCVELAGSAAERFDPVHELVFGGGRDLVTDVWVAGRQLLSQRELTRIDSSALVMASEVNA